MLNNLIQCDNCKEDFRLDSMKMKNEPSQLERHYIECPNCKEQYTSFFLDPTMKRMQAEIKRLQKKQPLKIKQRNKISKLSRQLHNRNEQYKVAYKKQQEKTGEIST